MPRTIDEGFKDFLTQLTPTWTETTKAKSHRESIEQCLDTNYGVLRMFRIGSFGNGTSISGYSDVDYLVSIKNMPSSSSSDYVLKRMREVLDTRFPNTGVRVNCPAIAVPFGTTVWERHEMVPGDFMKKEQGYAVYGIPDCADGWMRASPEAHNAYVREQNERLNMKVKPLIRYIKAWKYYRAVPISSFYLEMRVTKYCEEQTTILYHYDIPFILRRLLKNELAAMQDPLGVSGYIYPCKTDAQKEDALSKLTSAVSRAEDALEAAKKEDLRTAFERWRMLYGEGFPSYYY